MNNKMPTAVGMVALLASGFLANAVGVDYEFFFYGAIYLFFHLIDEEGNSKMDELDRLAIVTDAACSELRSLRRQRLLLVLLVVAALFAPPLLQASERDHQLPFCESQGGTAEVILNDHTRVDCLTNTHAIEVDYAKKWAEAIGQALHYSLMTGKSPGIAFIVRSESDRRYLKRTFQVINHWHLPIQVWVIDATTQEAQK